MTERDVTSGAQLRLAAALMTVASLFGCTSPAAIVPPPINRFIIVHSPHVERDTVLLDTVTGRSWELVSYTDLEGDPSAWKLMPQVNSTEDTAALMERIGTKEAARAAAKPSGKRHAVPSENPYAASVDEPAAKPARSKPPWEENYRSK